MELIENEIYNCMDEYVLVVKEYTNKYITIEHSANHNTFNVGLRYKSDDYSHLELLEDTDLHNTMLNEW